jgi:hypothetical protein
MQKKILSLICSLLFVFGFSLNGYTAEIKSPVVYTISDEPDVLDYPDSNSPYMQKYRQELLSKKVDPGKALGLSALYFGLGQLYTGDTKRGAWILAGGTVLLAGVLLVFIPRVSNRQESVTALGSAIGYVVLGVAYLWNIRDAYITAEKINQDINDKLLLSENIKKQIDKINLATANNSVTLTYKIIDF